jgi:hypothetical protein
MEKEIHTRGIVPYLARAKMWCVRLGEGLKASNSIEELRKYLNSPKARFGVWVEIRWINLKSINAYKNHRLIGFFDLDSGEFLKSLRKDYTDTNKFIGDVHITAEERLVIKAVWDHMGEKWQKKFKKDQQI